MPEGLEVDEPMQSWLARNSYAGGLEIAEPVQSHSARAVSWWGKRGDARSTDVSGM